MPTSEKTFTQADLDQVRDAAYELAMAAPSKVGDNPLLAVGALSLATVHAAVLTDTSFEDLVEMMRLQYVNAAISVAEAGVALSWKMSVS